MTSQRPHIVWFRDDLRLSDNPALTHAARSGAPLLALFLLEENGKERQPGGASRWWLHGSLESLAKSLHEAGVPLVLTRGPARMRLLEIANDVNAVAVSWNRRAGRVASGEDDSIAAALHEKGVESAHFKANVLFEADEVRTKSGGPFRVFTPFWRAASQMSPEKPLPVPSSLTGWKGTAESEALADWSLRPTKPDWAGGLAKAWHPGEADAQSRLEAFLEGPIGDYRDGRDHPAEAATSRLSPSLRFGEISPRQIWHGTHAAMSAGAVPNGDGEKFLAELGWREFCHHLAETQPDLASENFNDDFDRFPWDENPDALARWQRGRTGYPIVDAGMRELWATGWMHNRVRMITASFLTKHLLLDWREGERWFWDTLVDADRANNPAGWQWVAGCGADAAPYFRIFNPVLQGEKFDADGTYTRHWVPELERLDKRWLHKPWSAPTDALEAAGIEIGKTYPAPIIDHSRARKRALEAYETIKHSG